VIVGGQEPGRYASVNDLFIHLGVAFGHQREQRRLRLGGNAVEFIYDLDAQSDPVAPGDFYVTGGASAHQDVRKRMAEQVLNSELRVSMLDRAANFLERMTGKQAHQGCHRCLASARCAQEDHSPRRHQVQKRQQHERRIARLVVELDPQLIALEALRCAGLDLRERRQKRMRANPVIGLTELGWQSIVSCLSELQLAVIRKGRSTGEPGTDELFGVHRRCPVAALQTDVVYADFEGSACYSDLDVTRRVRRLSARTTCDKTVRASRAGDQRTPSMRAHFTLPTPSGYRMLQSDIDARGRLS
jgi:hypothetical protein